jgi:hypothetical protein
MAPFWRENLLVQTQKKELKRRAHDLKNQDAKLVSNAGSNSRTQFASNESKVLPRNLNSRPHLNWALLIFQGKIGAALI